MEFAADAMVRIVLSHEVKGEDTILPIQNFVIGGQSMIPFFSSDERFTASLNGASLPYPTIEIRFGTLIGLMHGDERLIANPGTPEQLAFRVADLASPAGAPTP